MNDHLTCRSHGGEIFLGDVDVAVFAQQRVIFEAFADGLAEEHVVVRLGMNHWDVHRSRCGSYDDRVVEDELRGRGGECRRGGIGVGSFRLVLEC